MLTQHLPTRGLELLALSLLLAATARTAPAPLTQVDEGRSSNRIVVAADAIASNLCLEELQRYRKSHRGQTPMSRFAGAAANA
jgi:hypothetical protein